jgi:hypothetical protein
MGAATDEEGGGDDEDSEGSGFGGWDGGVWEGLAEVIEDVGEVGEIDGGGIIEVAGCPGAGLLAEVVEDDGEVGESDLAIDVGVTREDWGEEKGGLIGGDFGSEVAGAEELSGGEFRGGGFELLPAVGGEVGDIEVEVGGAGDGIVEEGELAEVGGTAVFFVVSESGAVRSEVFEGELSGAVGSGGEIERGGGVGVGVVIPTVIAHGDATDVAGGSADDNAVVVEEDGKVEGKSGG